MKIVINTPAGHVGRVVTDQLPQAKEEVANADERGSLKEAIHEGDRR